MQVGRVLEVRRYPVKSMGGELLRDAELAARGLPGDRAWAVRDELRGGIRGAKKLPALMQLQAQYPDEIDWLMRRAMLHEALGQTTQAIEFYQRTLAFMEDNPDGFDADSREPWQASLDVLQRALAQSP